MSIINPSTLYHLKSQRDGAQSATTYEKGYRLAMEGLNAAIALVETLQMAERDSTLVIRTNGQ
ncbi:hypothetical protein [Salmonella phage 7-11]|uniref:Uncharacterized protein n=1 Tax=Salmonella phage 7-11 TaxID=1054968 RepID=G0X559_9CAUD|nr:hypothetical protein SaPh711_gp126 [Salmonella phage 7-11]AEK82041.1 hypothetical protein [Salmonella phage 7-11]